MGWGALIGGLVAAAGSAASAALSDTGGGDIQQSSTMTPQQLKLLYTLNNILGGELGQPGEPVPGAGELQQQLFSGLSGEETAGAGSTIQAGSDYLNKLLSMDYDPTAGREYWEESFKKPMMQQWKQEIMPSIAEKYAGSGAISSSGFNRAMGTAATNMETQLGSQLSDILYQGSEAHKGRQIQGAGLSQQLANLLSETGGEQRNIGLQQWEAQQPWGNPWLNYLNLALNSKAFENSAQAPYQSPSPLGMAFNTLGNLGSMYAYKNF